MTTPIWIPQAQRLEIFNGKLLPATIGENKTKKLLIKKGSKLKDQNFSDEDCLKVPQLKMIGLRTDLDFIVIDIDGEKGSALAFEKGFDWTKHRTFFIGRRDNHSRFSFIYRRTPEQQKFGEIHQVDTNNEIDLFSSFRSWKVVLGTHPDDDLYCWFGQGPEDLSYCPDHVWDFVVGHIADYQQRQLITTTTKAKTPSHRGTWRPVRPCPICTRQKDNDCSINREGNFVQCHHGKTNHPPSLKIGETLSLNGDSWAFCKEGDNAMGRFSLFKKEKERGLNPAEEIYGRS